MDEAVQLIVVDKLGKEYEMCKYRAVLCRYPKLREKDCFKCSNKPR